MIQWKGPGGWSWYSCSLCRRLVSSRSSKELDDVFTRPCRSSSCSSQEWLHVKVDTSTCLKGAVQKKRVTRLPLGLSSHPGLSNYFLFLQGWAEGLLKTGLVSKKKRRKTLLWLQMWGGRRCSRRAMRQGRNNRAARRVPGLWPEHSVGPEEALPEVGQTQAWPGTCARPEGSRRPARGPRLCHCRVRSAAGALRSRHARCVPEPGGRTRRSAEGPEPAAAAGPGWGSAFL